MLLNPKVIISRGRVEIIGQFENTGHYLTVDQTTERIGVLKILNDAHANVYDFLMCILRSPTAGFAEQNGRDALANGRDA